jgi:hypothetical protein
MATTRQINGGHLVYQATTYTEAEAMPLIKFGIGKLSCADLTILAHDAARGKAYRGTAYWWLPPSAPDAARARRDRYFVSLRFGLRRYFPTDNLMSRWKYQYTRWMTPDERNAYEASHPPKDYQNWQWRPSWKAEDAGQPEHIYRLSTGYMSKPRPYGGGVMVEFKTWQEMIVGLTAHEMYHVEGYRTGRNHTEAQCEAWAADAIDRYRASQEMEVAAKHQ